MFSPEEIEALVLGTRWVAERAGGMDGTLASSARSALARIAAVEVVQCRGGEARAGRATSKKARAAAFPLMRVSSSASAKASMTA